MAKRHKWVVHKTGFKQCSVCNSIINSKKGFPKYSETDKWGVINNVNWYPRCQFDIKK